MDSMRIVAISDTHGCHRQLDISGGGDMILHAGDVCDCGDRDQVSDFLDWFDELPFPCKVLISDNHDFDRQTGESLLPDQLPAGVGNPQITKPATTNCE